MTDLFRTHKESLLAWMRQKGYFSSVDITEYGLRNYYLRAPRTARALARAGIIRRIPDNEAAFRRLNKPGEKHVAWYECKNA